MADLPEPMTEEQLRAVTVGELRTRSGPIALQDYDPAWPELYAREAEIVRAALGHAVLQLAHAGSTSVPGLAAKPIIDIILVVADSDDEDSYVPALEACGYVLRVREPDWFKHRMFRRYEPSVNVHVYSTGCEEVDRMLIFRDHLRTDETSRELYERTKRELAQGDWKFVQNYADAKTAVVEEIMTRAGHPRT